MPALTPTPHTYRLPDSEAALYAPDLDTALARALADMAARGLRSAVIFAGQPSDGAPVVARIDLDGLPPVGPFVVAQWNGIPADNSGRREVWFLTGRQASSGLEVWGLGEHAAARFETREAAERARAGLTLSHLREGSRVYPLATVHAATGGHPEGLR
jgi:hypothetical protein